MAAPDTRYWLALRAIPGVGDVLAVKIARRWGGPAGVFAAPYESLLGAGVREDVAAEIAAFAAWSEIDRRLEVAARLGIDTVAIDEPRYPRALRFTHDPPPVLWIQGALVDHDAQAIAIVGSRDASAYGVAVAERLARELAAAGVTVVSGLALGIDGAAHRGALASGGRTIAVLGSGVDRVYPERHCKLAERIAERGAVLSELPLGSAPARENFPRRNRIISGLVLGVVVVEAGERSGSLITARLALEQGREVFAVPGEAGLERTRGTHRLLRAGARLVEHASDIVEDVLPWLQRSPRTEPPRDPKSPEAAALLAAFEGQVEHVDRLIERSGLAAPRALEILCELELQGRVTRHPGMLFSRR